jgi:ribosomal protein S18 acetylase RimI-like enzyme
VGVDADLVAAAHAHLREHLIAGIPDGWARREGGVVAGVTGAAVPTLNGVWPESADPDAEAAGALLDEVAATGLPHCLQLRPGSDEAIGAMAAGRGMVKAESIPVMVRDDADDLYAAQQVPGVTLRQIAPEDAQVHARVAAAGFEAPKELFVELMTPEVLRQPGIRCYVGELDGQAITTGLGVTMGDSVAILNIATPPEHRGQGFGSAVTARAVSNGLNDGAKWSFLQSSAAGYGVYVRLGFVTVELWDCWLTPD